MAETTPNRPMAAMTPAKRSTSAGEPSTSAGTRSTPAAKRSTSAAKRSTSAAKRSTSAAKRSTSATRAAATRSRAQAASAVGRSATAPTATETRRELGRTPLDHAQAYAARAALIPVGAALVARDTVVATVEELRSSLATPQGAQRRIEADLERFERRGAAARTSVERDLKRTRTRAEREMHERSVRLGLVGARVENLVQGGITAGTQVAGRVTQRVARVA